MAFQLWGWCEPFWQIGRVGLWQLPPHILNSSLEEAEAWLNLGTGFPAETWLKNLCQLCLSVENLPGGNHRIGSLLSSRKTYCFCATEYWHKTPTGFQIHFAL